ncbi:MAG: lysylphosphatidylglycerol synthase domain-containing protein [Pirellulaceae bacterium]
MNDARPNRLSRVQRFAGPLFGLILFGIAISFLYKKTQEITWDQFVAGLAGIPAGFHLLAAILVAMNYLVLTGNDMLAVRYVGASRANRDDASAGLSYKRILTVSFMGYAFGNNVGAVAAGVPIRIRFYKSWGLATGQVVALIAFISLSFWIGICSTAGVALSLVEVPTPESLNLPVTSRILGFLLLSILGVYVAACIWWRHPFRLAGLQLRPPGPQLMVLQIAVASFDLMLAATTLYVLLPSEIPATYPQVVGVYLLALAAAMITQVPGGLGVLEAILLSLLATADKAAILGSLLIFRIYYYVVPLLVAAIVLVVIEAKPSRKNRAVTIDTHSSEDN